VLRFGTVAARSHIARTRRAPKYLSTALAKLATLALTVICSTSFAPAQELAPRAYVITPVHSNAVTLTWSFFDGGLNFNGAVPVTGASGRYNVLVFNYYHAFSFFGRSANITASLPYAVGNFSGDVLGR
jgi:hypothetical protein